MGGLFMFIMKDPARARALGLLGAKAQITAGTADWPTFLGVIAQATAVGGSFIFALVTAWVFGREFADRTVKLLLAVPTPRGAILDGEVRGGGRVERAPFEMDLRHRAFWWASSWIFPAGPGRCCVTPRSTRP